MLHKGFEMMTAWPRVYAKLGVRSNWIQVAFLPAKWDCLIHRVEKGKEKFRKVTPVELNCLM